MSKSVGDNYRPVQIGEDRDVFYYPVIRQRIIPDENDYDKNELQTADLQADEWPESSSRKKSDSKSNSDYIVASSMTVFMTAIAATFFSLSRS